MTISEHSPPELARETLRTLAVRKLAPTPENYTAIFSELSGVPAPRDRALRALAAALTGARWLDDEQRSEWLRLARSGDWERALAALTEATRPGGDSDRARLLEQIARLIEYVRPALGGDDTHMLEHAAALVGACRSLEPGDATGLLCGRLHEFNQRLAFVAEEQAEVRASLLTLLRTVFANIGEFTLGDVWMENQVTLLVNACQPPLTLRRLDDVHRRLEDLIFKQRELRQASALAQQDNQLMFSSFVAQLDAMAGLSRERSSDLAVCARRLQESTEACPAPQVLESAVLALEDMAERTGTISGELQSMHARMAQSEAELGRLRRELEAMSQANRHDALTGALNRKGLDEALVREVARARRVCSPLAISLLDIDNFKVINDQHGHPAGDAALAHLADMARKVMRAQDTLCRYGGEEFVVLMPDTALEDGAEAMRKLQRALTRELFLADSRRILITFSAGIAVLGQHEDAHATIERADRGMYQAKRSGKNRVVVA